MVDSSTNKGVMSLEWEESTILKMPTLIESPKMSMDSETGMVQQPIRFHMLNQTIRLLLLKGSMHANTSLQKMTIYQTHRLLLVTSNQVETALTTSHH